MFEMIYAYIAAGGAWQTPARTRTGALLRTKSAASLYRPSALCTTINDNLGLIACHKLTVPDARSYTHSDHQGTIVE